MNNLRVENPSVEIVEVFDALQNSSTAKPAVENGKIRQAINWVLKNNSWNQQNKNLTNKLIEYIVDNKESSTFFIFSDLFPNKCNNIESVVLQQQFQTQSDFLTCLQPTPEAIKEFIENAPFAYINLWIKNRWDFFDQKSQKELIFLIIERGGIFSHLSDSALNKIAVNLFDDFFPGLEVSEEKINRIAKLLERSNPVNELKLLINKKINILTYLSQRSEWTDPDVISHALSVKNSTLVTSAAISSCIFLGNRQLLNILIKDISSIDNETSLHFLKDMRFISDFSEVGDLLLEKGWNINSSVNGKELKEFFLINRFEAIDWLFNNSRDKIKITTENVDNLTLYAKKSGNLQIIQCISQNVPPEIRKVDLKTLVELTGDQTEKNRRKLFHYALNTPLPFLERYLNDNHPSLINVFEEIKSLLPYLVRLPVGMRKGVNKLFADRQTYEDMSMTYAQENARFINEIGPLHLAATVSHGNVLSPEINSIKEEAEKKGFFNTFLDAVVENRFARNPNLLEQYRINRKNVSDFHTTPIYNKIVDDRLGFRPTRYVLAFDHALKFHRLRAKTNTYGSSVEVNKKSVLFNYPFEKGDIPMTAILIDTLLTIRGDGTLFLNGDDDFARQATTLWFHTMPAHELNIEMERVHCAILRFPTLNAENKKEFLELVTRGYWLVSTICQKARGTPHNAMMWLCFAYQSHGLHPPIPKLQSYYLDNEMLVMPVQQAIDLFSTLLEDTPTPTLKRIRDYE